jgi:hypothetical protein
MNEVIFHFFSGKNPKRDHAGSVLLRAGKMTLDIPLNSADGYGPYLIEGKKVEHHFEGKSVAPGRSLSTEAQWADVGNYRYVGVWIEDGEEYLFSFALV